MNYNSLRPIISVVGRFSVDFFCREQLYDYDAHTGASDMGVFLWNMMRILLVERQILKILVYFDRDVESWSMILYNIGGGFL